VTFFVISSLASHKATKLSNVKVNGERNYFSIYHIPDFCIILVQRRPLWRSVIIADDGTGVGIFNNQLLHVDVFYGPEKRGERLDERILSFGLKPFAGLGKHNLFIQVLLPRIVLLNKPVVKTLDNFCDSHKSSPPSV